jgi:hypothetical protein
MIWFYIYLSPRLKHTQEFLFDSLKWGTNFFRHFSCDLWPISSKLRRDQGLLEFVILNFIFKWYSWSNFRLLTA